ncbi:hypothetical protein MCC_06010 [Rickettsia rhipicephali str. 3-7-female6-CWPP]|uniref:Uncharacterized protein n=1 Tax=Rickettsia rhipicephali (strain 3-7-female6-CWPP) TaxID=1105113 RepID=A0AAI8F7E9_RICR3|nr:hypothetical protein MCC_06010 [Rickettsia rhipicephali str. 3-7-female6-CWPP]
MCFLNLSDYGIKIILLSIVCLIIIFDINKVHASAWLLEQGRYRYIVGGNKVNKISKNEKKQREESVLYIRERVAYLWEYLKK